MNADPQSWSRRGISRKRRNDSGWRFRESGANSSGTVWKSKTDEISCGD